MSHKIASTILLIDDDEDIRTSLSLYLKLHFQKVLCSETPAKLNELISHEAIDLVLLDMNFRMGQNDGKEGIYWLQHIKELKPNLPVVLITAYGNIELAVESLKNGASDFLVKPWNNQKLLHTLMQALEISKSRRKLQQLESVNRDKNRSSIEDNFLEPRSKKMQQLLQIAQRVAATDANILITGENGTGKEVIARYVHLHSKRAEQPMVNLDLGSVNENLFEAELFGYKKGAFTDAREDRAGKFELAQGGTLFLDEIGNIPLSLQSKLLTAIQTKSINPVGSNNTIHIDCRIICATNMELNKAVFEGNFRQDLLFRINTIELELPPLRERREDIPGLALHFLKRFNNRYHKNIEFDEDVFLVLQEYSWPGNIRELQHVIERSVILADTQKIIPEDLNLNPVMRPLTEDSLDLDLEELEKRHIYRTLKKYEGNISHAAKALKINRNTLYRKIEKYGL